MLTGMKTCTTCGRTKPLTEFGKHKSTKDGLRYVCRSCNNMVQRKWGSENPEKARAISANWTINNCERRREHARDYMRRRRSVAPGWLTAIQHAQMDEFYDVAVARTMQTGIPHVVDHIHALKGKNFRGLHVPWNLQVVTAIENHAKYNLLIDDTLGVP